MIPASNDPEPALWTARQVAKRLGISVRQVYALARCGDLPRVKIRRSTRFDCEAVEDWRRRGCPSTCHESKAREEQDGAPRD